MPVTTRSPITAQLLADNGAEGENRLGVQAARIYRPAVAVGIPYTKRRNRDRRQAPQAGSAGRLRCQFCCRALQKPTLSMPVHYIGSETMTKTHIQIHIHLYIYALSTYTKVLAVIALLWVYACSTGWHNGTRICLANCN